MLHRYALLIIFSLLSAPVFAEDTANLPIDEFAFIKEISGKDKAYVTNLLGEPASKETRENDGGEVEFWIYKNVVKIAGSDKVYKYTQVGIVNNAVETVGNTNLTP
jgi:hypothetical protein